MLNQYSCKGAKRGK